MSTRNILKSDTALLTPRSPHVKVTQAHDRPILAQANLSMAYFYHRVHLDTSFHPERPCTRFQNLPTTEISHTNPLNPNGRLIKRSKKRFEGLPFFTPSETHTLYSRNPFSKVLLSQPFSYFHAGSAWGPIPPPILFCTSLSYSYTTLCSPRR